MAGGDGLITICGFMGSGKSTLGPLVAERLGRDFVDLDDVIVARAGMPIPQIFQQFGEDHFRDLEHQAALQMCASQNMVMAAGGGTLTYQRNVEPLRQSGTILFLDVPFDECYNRIQDSDRPLVRNNTRGELEAIFDRRRDIYRQAAQREIAAVGTVEQCLARALQALERPEPPKTQVRDMTPGDTGEVLDLWLRSTIAGHPFLSEDYWRRSMQKVREEYLPAASTRVCSGDSGLLGFCSILDDSFIGALFVAPEAFGRGVGSQLLEDVKQNRESLELAVYRDNGQAVRFYQKHGFVEVEQRPNDDTSCPELLMRWVRD